MEPTAVRGQAPGARRGSEHEVPQKLKLFCWCLLQASRTNLRIFECTFKTETFNPRIALEGKKSPQLSFWICKNFCWAFGAVLSWLFPEYEVGAKCNNQVANRCTRSCLAWRQTRDFFLKLAKFYGHVDNMTKQIQNK